MSADITPSCSCATNTDGTKTALPCSVHNMTRTATVEEWETMFRPITNTISDEPSWQNQDGAGIMFSISGQEHELVCRHNLARRVWTWIDGTDGTYIVSGYSFVNRIGYFITEVPYGSGDDWEIKVEDYNE
jgi:hypothetical protein